MRRFRFLWLLISAGAILVSIHAQDKAPLRLVQTIPMPNVEGRIDHMAVDLAHKRLCVAALVNNTLEVLDLRAGKVSQTVTGLKEPQGVVFVPETGILYVTTGGDGKCFAFSCGIGALWPGQNISFEFDPELPFIDPWAVPAVGWVEGGVASADRTAPG